MVTYGLLGPIFAIYRPIVAFFSGIIGGALVSILDKEEDLHDNVSSCDDDCCDDEGPVMKRVFDYGFIKLPQDIAQPLIIGIITAALIFFFIPENYFDSIGVGIVGMIIMLILGLPSYVCATASIFETHDDPSTPQDDSTYVANRHWLGAWKTTHTFEGNEWPVVGKAVALPQLSALRMVILTLSP